MSNRISLSVVDVRFEHHPNPAIGIGEARPRISWRFTGDVRKFHQTWYQLSITWQGSSDSKLYEVKSSESVLVPWPCQDLSSGQGARVRVRVTGKAREGWTEWSEFSEVEAGLLEDKEWTGASVIQPASELNEISRPVTFRRSLATSTKDSVARARLYISAQGVYEASLDGQKIGDEVLSPGWTSYAHRLVYQTYDITSLFTNGQPKSLTVDVGEGWFSGRLGFLGGRSNIYGNSLGLIAILRILLENGSSFDICTDSEWDCSYGPILSSQLYDGERYDARLSAKSQEDSRTWYPVRSSHSLPKLVAPDGPPVKKTQEMRPVSARRLKTGGPMLVDFGQNFVGHVRICVRGTPGAKIRIQHAEVLENGCCATRPLRFAQARDEIILGEGKFEWEPKFTFHGFRYVEADGLGHGNLKNITGIVIGTDMTRTGHFSCSNPLLNRLHENAVWSMRSNFVSIPTDCPQRDERLGWTGDINMFADTANFLFDCRGVLCSWLKDLTAEQNNGIVPLTVPNVMPDLDKEAHAIWGDVAIMLPWSLYWASGDLSILSRQYESMKNWLKAIPRRNTGLWDYQSLWKLGDWLDPAAPPDDCGNALTDPNLVADSFLVHVIETMKEISGLLKLSYDSAMYKNEEKVLRKAFEDEYLTTSGRMVCDTQTAYALAIEFSLIKAPNQLRRAADRLSTLIRRNSRFKIGTGFAGTPYIGHALTKVGLNSLFYRMLLHRQNPSWLYPITMGATTIWERWDSMLPDGSVNPGEMTSFNHYALGAVCQWMHRTIVGLRPLEPGWKRFAVEPIPGGGLTWAEALYFSVYGEITVTWRLLESAEESMARQRGLYVKLVVPPNSTAHVKLPGWNEVQAVTSGSHEWECVFEEDQWPPKAEYPPNLERDDDLPDDENLPWLG